MSFFGQEGEGYLTHVNTELLILQLPCSECWDYGCVVPHPTLLCLPCLWLRPQVRLFECKMAVVAHTSLFPFLALSTPSILQNTAAVLAGCCPCSTNGSRWLSLQHKPSLRPPAEASLPDFPACPSTSPSFLLPYLCILLVLSSFSDPFP